MLDGGPEDLLHHLKDLRRRLKRERAARLEAEAIAEAGLRELYDKKEQLELLRTMAVAATESRSIEEVLQFSIGRICEATGWPFGHAYMVRPAGEQRGLVPTTICYGSENSSFQFFKQATETMELDYGVGLPGRVLATGRPAWITEIAEDNNFPRLEAALTAGLVAGFAFPVVVRSEVVAILEFFSDKATSPNEFFSQLAAEIGIQLGRVVERRRTEDQLIHDAFHDPLTGLPNRAFFLNRLQQAVALCTGETKHAFAVFFIDLDRFKIVNDSLGHHAGDELLIAVTERLLACLLRERQDNAIQPSEVVTDVLARLGGDEFTILLMNLGSISVCAELAAKVNAILAQPFNIGGRAIYVSASIGIAWSLTGYTSADEMMRDADLAMYRAKAAGAACYQIYDQTMHAQALARLEMEANLRHGLKHTEYVLHYQPIIDLRTGRIVGLEALVRWQQTDFDLIYPDKFIGIAEDTGLIIPIDTWVLHEACRAVCEWHTRFPQETPLTISVNLSARQFCQTNLAAEVARITQETGIDPRSVRLEITESVTMDDAERTIRVLSELRRLGIQFSIDDFGTGFSSLSYLGRFPLHILKIDRSFVNRMEKDHESLAIVKSIISLAHGLGMKVVAEGTETASQVAHLTHLGCDYAQGFFYSKPVASTAIFKLLEDGITFNVPLQVPEEIRGVYPVIQ